MAPHQPKDYTTLLIPMFVASLLLLLDLVGFLNWYKSARAYILVPVTTAIHNIKIATSEGFLSTIQGSTLKRENLDLRQKVIELESLSNSYSEELKANSELHKFYETTKATVYKKTVNAQILDTHADQLSGKLLLNKGTSSGIAVGMPVVIANFYVGFVSKVTPLDSTCTTFEIPGQEFVGYIQSKKITGIVRVGINGMELGDLLATEQVSLHDIITIRRDEYPYFFTLGTATKIPLNNGSAERSAIIESAIQTNSLSYVTIIKE